MTYFRLQQDHRKKHGVMLTDLNRIKNYKDGAAGNISLLNHMSVSFVNPSKLNYYPDVLDRQLFMVKGAVQEAFQLFVPDMEYRYCCLLDNDNNSQVYYSIPIMPRITGKSVMKAVNADVLLLDPLAINDLDVFQIVSDKEIIVVISLPVAECILRRPWEGIRLTKFM